MGDGQNNLFIENSLETRLLAPKFGSENLCTVNGCCLNLGGTTEGYKSLGLGICLGVCSFRNGAVLAIIF